MSQNQSSVLILTDATATGAGLTHSPRWVAKTYLIYGSTTSGSGASVVRVEVSNDNITFVTLGTATLTLGTSVTAEGFGSLLPWRYVRANVVSISGTGAKVSVVMGG